MGSGSEAVQGQSACLWPLLTNPCDAEPLSFPPTSPAVPPLPPPPAPILPSSQDCGFPQVQSAHHMYPMHSRCMPSLGVCRHLLGLPNQLGAISPHLSGAHGETQKSSVWATSPCLGLKCGSSQGCDALARGLGMKDVLAASCSGSLEACDPVFGGTPSSHGGLHMAWPGRSAKAVNKPCQRQACGPLAASPT